MPLYSYKCDCGYTGDHWNKMDEYEPCPKCSVPMKRVLGGFRVIGDIDPYMDENLGTTPVLVKSKKHREQLMKQHNVSEKFGKGWI